MATFNKFFPFVEAVAEKVHNLATDSLKVALSNVAPAQANSVFADITEIAAGHGYTAGGNVAAQTTSSQTAGVYKLVLADPATWVATSNSFAAFRYAVLYNDTAPSKNLIGWWDYGSTVTLTNNDSFTVDFDPTTGVLTIT
jgi:hypothetical protein